MGLTNQFFERIIEHDSRYNKNRLHTFLEDYFSEIDISKKRVLEIGGGGGLLSLYCVLKGAELAINLEPILDGSESIVHPNDLANLLPDVINVNKYNWINQKLQDFNSDTTFDLIVSYNSINHIDEDACENLYSTDNRSLNYSSV